jgi:glycosyltransferase involved in cell wall biosynthesis
MLKILALAPFPPRNDAAHGGGRCVAKLLIDLSSRARLALVYFREPGEPGLDLQLRERCEFVTEVPRPRVSTLIKISHAFRLAQPLQVSALQHTSFRDTVSRAVEQWHPDIVHAEFLPMAQYLDVAGAHRRVLRIHEVGAAIAAEAARSSTGMRHVWTRWVHRGWLRYEPAACARADAIAVLTPQDQDRLMATPADYGVRVIPPDLNCPPHPLNPAGQGATVLFFGCFSHRPNVDAALRLATRIFPLVREQVSHAVLHIVGPNPPRAIQRLRNPGVWVTGEVPSVEPWLDRAAVVAAPLRLGGGIRIKVLEALAHGKAVVASSRAVEGLAGISEREIMLADSDRDSADAIVRLLLDSPRRCAMAQAARRWAERRSSTQGADAFMSLYQDLTTQHPIAEPAWQ